MKTTLQIDGKWVFPIALLIIVILDALTNTIDITRNQWDYVYYLALARDGFNTELLASPFVYRFFTPFLVNGITKTGLSTENGFLLVTYIGALVQLTGIFYFVRWATRSTRGAWIAFFVTALSLFNVKFLVFDPFRPDHLAYGLILLQTYFAFERKFIPLLLLTLLGSTIREFNLIPLAAYLFALIRDQETRPIGIRHGLISAFFVIPAVLLPRLLIPVTQDFQIISLNLEGLLTAIAFFFIPRLMINFIFSVIAYFLPLLLLANLKDLKPAFQTLPATQRNYLLGYTFLVLLMSFWGGTDYTRFATFLFLPQIILIGLLEPKMQNPKIVIAFLCLFIFNRLWMHIPDWDVQAYRDFFGGFASQLNIHTAYRFLELLFFILIGYAINRQRQNETQIP